jgi:glycerate kinase
MNHIVVAPDKFKGTLSAGQVAEALGEGLARTDPDATVMIRPMADGGEGTLDACSAVGYVRIPTSVVDPWGRSGHQAEFVYRNGSAVIELATLAGGSAFPEREDPLGANTFAVGQAVAHALALGATEVVLGVGGSISTDGGAGMLQALGARLVDREGRSLPPGLNAVRQAVRLDLSELDPRVGATRFILAADVTNPLLGRRGCAQVFGPQKGATITDIVVLERRLEHWARLVSSATRTDHTTAEGAGAAGGSGFAALAVLRAAFRRGVDTVADMINLDAALCGADLVLTGEGRLDRQSLSGKTPVGVAERARRQGVDTVAIAGEVALTPAQRIGAGFAETISLADLEPGPNSAMTRTAALLTCVGERIGVALAQRRTHPSTSRGVSP